MRGLRCAVTGVLAALAVHASASAQAVRGVIKAPNGAAVQGAIITLRDSTKTPIARGLTDGRGEFLLRLPNPGLYSFHIIRLGFRPFVDSAFRVDANEFVTRQVTMTEVPVTLTAVEVSSERTCLETADSTSAAFDVWNEARKALLTSQLTRLTRAYSMDVALFQSRQLNKPYEVQNVSRRDVHMETIKPFVTLSPEQLAADGFMTRTPQIQRYYAPDETVLLSAVFADTHCLRVLPDSGNDGLVRLGFTPLPARKQPEISGVLFVDRATSELRRIEFDFVNLRSDDMRGAPGGEMIFRRLSEGSWIIEYWALGIPFYEEYADRDLATPVPPRTARGAPPPPRPVTTARSGRTITGGGVTRVQSGEVVLWQASEPPVPRLHTPAAPDR